MPLAAIRRQRGRHCSEVSTTCWPRARGGNGGRDSVSLVLVSWWIRWVLVTISWLQKLARGISPQQGLGSFGKRGTKEDSAVRQPITVTGGRLQAHEEGVPAAWEHYEQFYYRAATSSRKTGIDPAEGVLGFRTCEL
jgi:hypothetical protein